MNRINNTSSSQHTGFFKHFVFVYVTVHFLNKFANLQRLIVSEV